jgi:glycosyltransferase involved in cell wall biosynthesis
LDLALRAFAHLHERHAIPARTRLVIVGGGGSHSELLFALTETLGLEGHVSWTAHLSDGELRWLYEHCELLLSTSAVEGFCLPVAEALAAGARVACTDIPSHSEVGGDMPEYFLPIAAPGKVAEAIARALARPKSAPGQQRFTPAITATAALTLYTEASRRKYGHCAWEVDAKLPVTDSAAKAKYANG